MIAGPDLLASAKERPGPDPEGEAKDKIAGKTAVIVGIPMVAAVLCCRAVSRGMFLIESGRYLSGDRSIYLKPNLRKILDGTCERL